MTVVMGSNELKKVILILLTFVLAVVSTESSVLELDDDNFLDEVRTREWVMILFYEPNCHHCTKFEPEYEMASKTLKDYEPPIYLAKIDCNGNGKKTCGTYSVHAYPTLKVFKNGKEWEYYKGPRKQEDIVRYMTTTTAPETWKIHSDEGLDKFLDNPFPGVVAFGSQEQTESIFSNLAEKYRQKMRFGTTSLSIKDYPESGIVLFRPKHLHSKLEPNSVIFDGEENHYEIEEWILKNVHGLVGLRTRENMRDFKYPLVVAYYNVDYKKDPKGSNYWRNRIMKVAQNFAYDFTFAISNYKDFTHELSEFGYPKHGSKPIIIGKTENYGKYLMDEEFSMETFEKFLNKLKSGELEAFIKSEKVPEVNDGPVKIAVGKNFNEIVMENKKDTMIEFYAPWCGYCKTLEPIWNELAERLIEEDIDIVKIDASNNDVPDLFEIQGYPTIYLLKKDDKHNPVIYTGPRTVEDFIKFIASKMTSEMLHFDRNGNAKVKEEL